jgi:D-alanyl-D-alanine carboxypeptidase
MLFPLALTLSPALAQAPEGKEYIVQADDWLSKIAEKEYGDVLAYPSIVEATNAKAAEDDSYAVIDNPDLIEIGQKLWIPAAATLTLSGKQAGRPIDTEQCIGVTNAPDEVVAALDEALLQILDPTPGRFSGAFEAPAPGVVIRVESPDWIYYEAGGVANVETQEPVRCDMPHAIGSITKTMTAVVIMQLQEEGLLNVADPLADYQPDYAAALPFGDQITVRQLLNHTSGIFSYTDNTDDGTPGIMEGIFNEELAVVRPDLLTQGYTPDELVQWTIDNGEPYFEPGAEGQYKYSSTNYVLLGLIIEDLTGQELADVFEERIFTPLGMDDTFLWNDVPEDDFGLPESYAPGGDNVSDWNMSQGWAAGGVISTADDMHLFIQGLLTGELFNDDQTLASMQEDPIHSTDYLYDYGLGINREEDQGNTWGHRGQTTGFISNVRYNVTNDISIVTWTNSSYNPSVLAGWIIADALREAGIEP